MLAILENTVRPRFDGEVGLREFEGLVEEEMRYANRSDASNQEDLLPLVIRQRRSVVLKRAWLSLQRIIKDNESLPENKRVPEPYFARAEIWTAVNNYPEAMKDYVTALRYASSTGRELKTYARYHAKVETTINQFTLVPAPAAGASLDTLRIGAKHFGLGVTAFRSNHHGEANRHFGNAISVEPDNPLYWYYRSVTSRRTGDPNQAVYDALYGAFVESKRYSPYKRRRIARGLQHIQGKERVWLEGFRLGDPSARIIRAALEPMPPQANGT